MRRVPEPLPVVRSQSHWPKQGLDQSLAAWAAIGRRAATRRGLKTMASRTSQKTNKISRRKERKEGCVRRSKKLRAAKNEGGITRTREDPIWKQGELIYRCANEGCRSVVLDGSG